MIHKNADKIKAVDWLIPKAPEYPDYINDVWRNFLDSCFKVNQDERLSVFELLQHEYLK